MKLSLFINELYFGLLRIQINYLYRNNQWEKRSC
jgi:hypothetical protein